MDRFSLSKMTGGGGGLHSVAVGTSACTQKVLGSRPRWSHRPHPGCTRALACWGPQAPGACGRGRPALRDPAPKGRRQHPQVRGGTKRRGGNVRKTGSVSLTPLVPAFPQDVLLPQAKPLRFSTSPATVWTVTMFCSHETRPPKAKGSPRALKENEEDNGRMRGLRPALRPSVAGSNSIRSPIPPPLPGRTVSLRFPAPLVLDGAT